VCAMVSWGMCVKGTYREESVCVCIAVNEGGGVWGVGGGGRKGECVMRRRN
jgi:hypothetical protein